MQTAVGPVEHDACIPRCFEIQKICDLELKFVSSRLAMDRLH
jgi:hypothetical protein